jgi:predicted esterase
MVTSHTIATTLHGRYLVELSRTDPPVGLVIGFHGYGEGAEAQFDRLHDVPGISDWVVVSIQGLHRFYNRRSQDVVASWMTNQDRELAIADNVAYVSAVIDTVAQTYPSGGPLVFAGFSQGVAMAFRAACASSRVTAGLVSVGGDVPPELDSAKLAAVKSVLLARGERDEWYTDAKWEADKKRLMAAGVHLRALGYAAGHEWNADVSAAVAAFLSERRSVRR